MKKYEKPIIIEEEIELEDIIAVSSGGSGTVDDGTGTPGTGVFN